ncbi:MAG: hypothetical protein U5L45_18635 [Saprospiraceae bacterium]|nr:hypothetical protein [Saprospiraceae bacterium]
MVHFSGKARKMNHLSSFCASEASAKVPFNAYFEFMYGFKKTFKTDVLKIFMTKYFQKVLHISKTAEVVLFFIKIIV